MLHLVTLCDSLPGLELEHFHCAQWAAETVGDGRFSPLSADPDGTATASHARRGHSRARSPVQITNRASTQQADSEALP